MRPAVRPIRPSTANVHKIRGPHDLLERLRWRRGFVSIRHNLVQRTLPKPETQSIAGLVVEQRVCEGSKKIRGLIRSHVVVSRGDVCGATHSPRQFLQRPRNVLVAFRIVAEVESQQEMKLLGG